MPASYCTAKHPGDGWLCILAHGHDGAHLSLDNRQQWEGTPGRPVRWQPTPAKAPAPEGKLPERLALPTPAGKSLGYTGIPCDACQSLNTVRSGKCLTCMDCHAAGECG